MPLKRIYKTILILVALGIAAVNLSAWSISDHYLGNSIPVISARNLSMGNTGVYDHYSPMSVYLNPANLSILQGMYGLAIGSMFTRNEDNRSFPLYNSFNTYIDNATYSSNVNLFDNYGLGGFVKPLGSEKFNLGLGLFYFPVSDFSGKYIEEVRNNRNSDNDGYPEVIAYNEIANEGNLNALGFALSGGYIYSEGVQVNLGASLNKMGGSSEYMKTIKWTEWSMTQSINSAHSRRNVLPDSLFLNKSEYSGLQAQIGTTIKINNRLGLGISYSFKSKLDRDSMIRTVWGPDTTMAIPATSENLPTTFTETDVKDVFVLPTRIRFGFNYQPRNIMRTNFNAELEYVKWDDITGLFSNTGVLPRKFRRESWDLHVGVEHHVKNRLPLRIGFQSKTEWQAIPNYKILTASGRPTLEASKLVTPSITGGSSVSIRENITLDIGFIHSWREYQALDLFRDSYYNDKQYNLQANGLPSPTYLLWPNSFILPTDRGWDNPDKIRETLTQIVAGLTFVW